MFYSSSDFAMRGPPPPPLDLDGPPAAPLAAASAGPVQLTTPRKKSSTDASRSCSSEDELEEPTSTEHETEADADASATGEEDDALRLRGGVVRRRKKSPTKRALDDLAKAWAVNLGDDPLHAKHDRVGRSPTGRGTPEKRYALFFLSFPPLCVRTYPF
ncbi:uncharacterized protein JCM15063_002516 [Sporobolomyces koalae]|uniref:uncharacterized protein n=1 Tax=Sporobolomyces koalae TaxID=500713 RepID=UPI00316ECAB2